jgi:AcrR family transcriptional regulator
MKPQVENDVNGPQDGAEGVADRRQQLLSGACGYVIENGLAGLSLRPLAAALGTSDRMLLYHFGSRDRLVSAILESAAASLREILTVALVEARVSPAEVLAAGVAAMRDPQSRALLKLLVQVVGLAAQGDPVCLAVGRDVAGSWLAWLAGRLDVPAAQAEATAAALLVIIDGLGMLVALDQDDAALTGVELLSSLLGSDTRDLGPKR